MVHLNSNRILCVLPVHRLVKLSLCIKMLQVLHLLLLHGIFPGWVGGAASLSSARTSMSLRFLGRRNATIGVSWGWLPSAFLRYVGWGGVFSVSWLCCGGWDGRSLQAAPFGWGFLVPCGPSVCWFWMYGRPSQFVCPRSLPHNLWLSDVPSVLQFSSGSRHFWSIFF